MSVLKRKQHRFKYPFLSDSKADNLFPKRLGNVPEYVIELGMMSKEEYAIYSNSSGNLTISEISEQNRISREKCRVLFDILLKKELVSLHF